MGRAGLDAWVSCASNARMIRGRRLLSFVFVLLPPASALVSCATGLDSAVDASVGIVAAPDASLDASRVAVESGLPVIVTGADAALPHDATTPTMDAPKTLPEAASVPDVAAVPDSAPTPDAPVATPDAGVDAGKDAGKDTGPAGGGSVIPTTCAGAYQGVGCCGPDGKNYYCTMGGTVGDEACTGSKVCGWKASAGEYACVNPPSEADPSGTNPIDCK